MRLTSSAVLTHVCANEKIANKSLLPGNDVDPIETDRTLASVYEITPKKKESYSKSWSIKGRE
jgi:hypothetical protein